MMHVPIIYKRLTEIKYFDHDLEEHEQVLKTASYERFQFDTYDGT